MKSEDEPLQNNYANFIIVETIELLKKNYFVNYADFISEVTK